MIVNYGECLNKKYRFYMIHLAEDVWKVGIGTSIRPRASLNEFDHHFPNCIRVCGMSKQHAEDLEKWVLNNYWQPPKMWFRKHDGKYSDEVVYIPRSAERANEIGLLCEEGYVKTMADLEAMIKSIPGHTKLVEFPLPVPTVTYLY